METELQEKQEANWKFTNNTEDGLKDRAIGSKAISGANLEHLSKETSLFKWTAVDSFSAKKRIGWYLALLTVTIVFSLIVYLLTKDKITVSVIIVCGVLLGFYAAKKPKDVSYAIDDKGFSIGSKHYLFDNFRSFELVIEEDNISAVLIPLRRFLPYTYINFNSEIQNSILPPLYDNLPHESKRVDIIERTFRRIGF